MMAPVSEYKFIDAYLSYLIIVCHLASDRQLYVSLLGAGESGKSTIVKQMRILHVHDFDLE